MKELTRKEKIRLSDLLYRYSIEKEGEEDCIKSPTPIRKIVNMLDSDLQ